MNPKIFIYGGTLLMLFSLAAAFNLDVVCPNYAFLPGDEVSCRLHLNQDISQNLFGMQFVIQAENLGPAERFFQPFDPLVGRSGGPEMPTVLFTLLPFAVEAGDIAQVNLAIPPETSDGDYPVSLESRILSGIPDGIAGTTFDSNGDIIYVRAFGRVGGMPGDVNVDGRINVLDILKIIEHITGKTPLPAELQLTADTNGDGNITVLDIIVLIDLITGR